MSREQSMVAKPFVTSPQSDFQEFLRNQSHKPKASMSKVNEFGSGTGTSM